MLENGQGLKRGYWGGGPLEGDPGKGVLGRGSVEGGAGKGCWGGANWRGKKSEKKFLTQWHFVLTAEPVENLVSTI